MNCRHIWELWIMPKKNQVRCKNCSSTFVPEPQVLRWVGIIPKDKV